MCKLITLLASTGVQVLDVTGPAAVFSAANDVQPGRQHYLVRVVSPAGGLIETMSSVSLQTIAIE
ncbi:MAG: hypothetical protein L3J02_07165, partial [Henriciella sp.]|nr:hypothetical protein [Henriciella sp.]